MVVKCWSVVIFWLIGLTSFVLHAKPKLIEEVKPYTIDVKQVESYLLALPDKATSVESDSLFHGGAKWKVKWNYQTQERKSRCRIKKVKVKVKVVYHLPELSSQLENSMSQGIWQQYYQALYKHEQAHKDIVMQTASDIEQAIKSVGSRKSCEELYTVANEAANQLMIDYQTNHQNFDIESDFGRKQGVSFHDYAK